MATSRLCEGQRRKWLQWTSCRLVIKSIQHAWRSEVQITDLHSRSNAFMVVQTLHSHGIDGLAVHMRMVECKGCVRRRQSLR
jgi:hypothetical protein